MKKKSLVRNFAGCLRVTRYENEKMRDRENRRLRKILQMLKRTKKISAFSSASAHFRWSAFFAHTKSRFSSCRKLARLFAPPKKAAIPFAIFYTAFCTYVQPKNKRMIANRISSTQKNDDKTRHASVYELIKMQFFAFCLYSFSMRLLSRSQRARVSIRAAAYRQFKQTEIFPLGRLQVRHGRIAPRVEWSAAFAYFFCWLPRSYETPWHILKISIEYCSFRGNFRSIKMFYNWENCFCMFIAFSHTKPYGRFEKRVPWSAGADDGDIAGDADLLPQAQP